MDRLQLIRDAAGAVRARQVAGRVRRLVPVRWVAAGRPAAGRWRPLAEGLGVDPAPQGGAAPPPAASGVFEGVGARRAAAAAGFWTDDRDGLLFLFFLHGFAPLAEHVAGPRDA